MAIYLFGDFELDTSLYQLRQAGEIVDIGPRVFDVLAYLIRYRERLVSKDELIHQVWGVSAMSGSSVPTCIAAVRKVLGDDPANPLYVETHRGRGYRFIADVSQAGPEPDSSGPSAAPGSAAPLRDMQRAGFVGRESELAALYAAFERTLSGTPQLILVAGEPGIGKTRTIEEFALSAHDDGAVVLIGRCIEGEGAPAFWPWVQIVRSHIDAFDTDHALHSLGPLASSLLLMIPELGDRHPDLPQPPQLDAERARFRLFDAVTALLSNAASERPLVVLIDDLHRADTASLLLLQFAARELRDAQVLFVGTYRDAEIQGDGNRAQTLSDIAREEPARCIKLHGLPIESVERFVAQSSESGTATQSLVAALYGQTGGNPFFLTQIVHLLTAEGDLGGIEPAALQRIDLPTGVRDAINRQLDGLPAETRRLLAVAAVAGRDFDTSATAAASSLDKNVVLGALEPALASHLIAAVPGQVGRYRFSHMLLRDCIYDDLPATQRVELHHRIGEALEDLHTGRLDARVAELAYHFHEAIPNAGPERAIDYSIEAAKWADSRLAYEDVPDHYRRALRLLDQKQPSDPLAYGNLLLTLGQAEIRAGERDRAQETFKQAVQIARDHDAPELLAHAALGLAPAFFAIEIGVFDPLLVSLLEEALGVGEAINQPLRSRLLARLSFALGWTDETARRLRLANESLAIAEETMRPDILTTALLAKHGCHWGPSQLLHRRSILTRIESVSSAISDPDSRLMILLLQITASLETGNVSAMHDQIAIFRHVATNQGRANLIWYSELFDSMFAILHGNFTESRRLAERFHVTGRQAGDRNVVHAYAAQMAILEFEIGNSEGILEAIQKIAYEHPTITGWRCTIAYLLAESGQLDDANAELNILAANNFAEYAHRETDGISLNLLATTCARVRNRTYAKRIYELLLPSEHTNTVIAYAVAYFGPVADRLGQLASAIGDHENAERHFTDAVNRCRNVGSQPWLARVQLHFAEHLASTPATSHLGRARSLIKESEQAARRLNMKQLLTKIALLRSRLHP